MKTIPSRLRRLDAALADLPLDEPMLLFELDGYLTALLVGPERIEPAEWMQGIWGVDGEIAPFEDPGDVRWFADAVLARHDEIGRQLARGKPQPLFDIDERNGDVLWDYWIDGFAQGMALRPDGWAESADADARDALSRLTLLIAINQDRSDLDSIAINALHDRAASDIVDGVARLHRARVRAGDVASAASGGGAAARVGRNDPCRCGSGRKVKRCCG